MIDEIGAADVVPIRHVLRSGVPVVATSHASSLDDLSLRDGIGGLIADGTFDVFVEILNTPPTYSLTVTKNGAAKSEPVTL